MNNIRCLWFVSICLSLGVCLTFIYFSWERWRQSPVIVAMDESQRPIWKVPFPAVTLCPQTKTSSRAFGYSQVHRRFFFNNVTKEEREIFLDLSLQCYINLSSRYNASSTLNNSVIDRIENFSLKPHSFIKGEFRDAPLSRSAFRPVLTDEGICFSFNMLPASHMFPENTFHASRNYLRYNMKPSWTSEGYDVTADRDAYPYRALSSGYPMGLFVKLIIDTMDGCNILEEGYKVQLHSPAEFPRPREHSLRIPLNSVVHVGITPSEIITDQDLGLRYDVLQRQCYFPNERHLQFFVQYTQQNCELECFTNITRQRCQCVAFYMPRDMETPICGHKNNKCVQESLKIFQSLGSELKSTGDKQLSFEEPENYTKCNCLQSCNHIRYETERSHSDVEIERFRQYFPNDVRNERYFTFLAIYFKESSFIPTRRMELYGRLAFLANCGGLLGLCLGMSVLSVFELIYWLFLRPLSRRQVRAVKDSRDMN